MTSELTLVISETAEGLESKITLPITNCALRNADVYENVRFGRDNDEDFEDDDEAFQDATPL